MSRSNGPGVPPNGWPPEYPPVDGQVPYQDPYYAQQQRPPQQAPAQPAPRQPRIQTSPGSRTPQAGLPPGGPPPAHYPPGQPVQGYPQPQYAPPQQQPNPYPQQRYASPPQAPQQPGHAPQPAPARQPQTNYPPQGDPRYAGYPGYDANGQPVPPPMTHQPAQPPAQAYQQAYAPAPAQQAYVPETTARPTQPPANRAASPYDGWTPPSQSQPAPAVDPRGYDLGHYMPAPTPESRTQRPTAPPAWGPELARQPAPSATFAPHDAGDLNASNQALAPVHDDEDYDDHEEYEDPPRKTRYGLIAASVIGAIVAGGGLAYAYKAYVAPQTQAAATPVVKSGTGPVKVKPADPGGTKFANADSKMMDSLSGTPASDTDGAPKAVKTLTIERDGSVAGAPAAPAAGQSPPVPGMIISGLPPPRTPVPAAAPPPAAAPLPQAAEPPPPAAAPAPAQKIATAAGPSVAAVKPAAKKPAPPAPPSAVGGPKGANGFVAVLASVPASETSRTQAMQQYADLQQKFGAVLVGKAPDVVDANVKNAPYHRLIVGPPGSRDAASGLCTQLKAAGYTADCWVTAF